MKLNRLEHFVLTSLCDDIEPLHMLYADALRELFHVDSSSFIAALVKLYRLGLAKPYFFDYARSKYLPVEKVTEASLQKHFSRRSEDKLRQYPDGSFGGEYFFEITEAGRKEEAKEIYGEYYPDTEAEAAVGQ